MEKPGSTPRTKLNRISHKASDSVSDLHSVLDDNLVAHVGIIFDGAPLVIPMAYGRVDNRLYLHGSSGSRLMRALTENPQICVSITELNGIKVARSTFNTGMHYRSAVIFGRAELVSDADKNTAMDAISDSMIPGRMSEVRPHTKKELAATLIIWVDLNETSVKISNNPVEDDEDDLGKGVWAGILPIITSIGTPIPSDAEGASLPLPQSIVNFRTGSSDTR
jgi:nitroimidazol reductase NimA-like FMN-containing flavoprotein (pyridoxamine 5'-phosphate oxidase superfamily)